MESEDYKKMSDIDEQHNTKKILLIGCGPGGKKHLTIEAYELIPTLDVALVDGLVTKDISSLLKPSCEIIDVTKKKGFHSASQEEINELLAKHASTGKQVGRLKGGDTAVFARTAEEAKYLIERGFEVQIVAGISSSLLACNTSGILPTVRGVSASFSVVSAHLKDSRFNTDWIELLNMENHTTIVLMGHSFAKEIKEAALNAGVRGDLPAAYISHVDLPTQKSVIGTLANLQELSELSDKPAVLIIGKSVSTHDDMPYIGEKILYGALPPKANKTVALFCRRPLALSTKSYTPRPR